MATIPIVSCRRLLDTLNVFYADLPQRPELDVSVVAPEDMPQPQRRLLVHNGDMTSTLERHHGEPIALRVLELRQVDDRYARHIVLHTAHSQQPVEYGALRVHLSQLEPDVRAEVLEGRKPLGGILNARGMHYRSCPGSFFKVFSHELMTEALGLSGPQWLYGRCNCLGSPDGRTIAEVVEILPPDPK